MFYAPCEFNVVNCIYIKIIIILTIICFKSNSSPIKMYQNCDMFSFAASCSTAISSLSSFRVWSLQKTQAWVLCCSNRNERKSGELPSACISLKSYRDISLSFVVTYFTQVRIQTRRFSLDKQQCACYIGIFKCSFLAKLYPGLADESFISSNDFQAADGNLKQKLWFCIQFVCCTVCISTCSTDK